MNQKIPLRESTLLVFAFFAGWLFSGFAQATTPRLSRGSTSFTVPFQGTDARAFCTSGNSMLMLDHPSRTLFVARQDGQLTPVEQMKGWAISDAIIFDRAPLYCSRNRILRRTPAGVEQTEIPGTSDLRSIATDGRSVFVLDTGGQPAIVKIDPRSGMPISRIVYDGIKPTDIAIHANRIFVLDMGDRCVHHIDPRSGRTRTRFQVGPGVTSGSGGIVFIGGQLYVHEADFGRLRPLAWKQDSSFVSSWMKPLTMTFVQESENVSSKEPMKIDFDVPIPGESASQVIADLQWSEAPEQITTDRFGQSIARFRSIELGPKGRHELSYTAKVFVRALQFNPPVLPLKTLDQIPSEIAETYLTSEPIYEMSTPEMIQAALDARADRDGNSASNVRSLISNIAWYVSDNLRYEQDDSWDDARTTLERGTGSCSEYSFVFASLCRLNKIPTRLVGGIQFQDYAQKHESDGFHRWTEVYFPTIGWIPVDVTKFDDGNRFSRDHEFLFGTPGYVIRLSEGGIDPEGLGTTYYIRRKYRGGKRQRRNYVIFEPVADRKSVEKNLWVQ